MFAAGLFCLFSVRLNRAGSRPWAVPYWREDGSRREMMGRVVVFLKGLSSSSSSSASSLSYSLPTSLSSSCESWGFRDEEACS